MRPHKGPTRTRQAAGIALITVLWLVSLLTVLATAAAFTTRHYNAAAHRSIDMQRARILADSAIRLKILGVIAGRQEGGAGIAFDTQLTIAESPVRVTLEREAARIDINVAEENLLTAFFAANGVDEHTAESFAARIVDWRDEDEATRVGGAELAEYHFNDSSYGPRNAAFESVEELRQVLGLSSISTELLNSLTVYTRATPGVDVDTPVAVVNALRWADERQMGDHRWLPDDWRNKAGVSGAVSMSRQALLGQVVRIHACPESTPSVCRVAVVRLTGNAINPFHVLMWRSEAPGVRASN